MYDNYLSVHSCIPMLNEDGDVVQLRPKIYGEESRFPFNLSSNFSWAAFATPVVTSLVTDPVTTPQELEFQNLEEEPEEGKFPHYILLCFFKDVRIFPEM